MEEKKEIPGNESSIAVEWTRKLLWLTFILTFVYALWAHINQKITVNQVIVNSGTIIPLSILLSSILIELGVFIMFAKRWAERQYAKWREEDTKKERMLKRIERDAYEKGKREGYAMGKAETILNAAKKDEQNDK